jgi:class 3 adenylate cyclase
MSKLKREEGLTAHVQDKVLTSTFDETWSEEFMEKESQLQATGICCMIVSCFFLVVGTRNNLAFDHPWKPVAFWSDLLFGAILLVFASLLTFKIFRPFATEYFNVMACGIVSITYMSQMLPHIVAEVHRSQSDNFLYSVQLKIDYTGSWPVRSCNDTDPVETWTSLAMRSPIISCSNSLFSGDILSQFLSFFIVPFLCQMHHRVAIYLTIALGIIFTVACLLLGSGWGMVFPLAAQLAVGLVTIQYCHVRLKLAKQSFAIVKRTQLTAERNRALIHTFIPKNVLLKLALHPEVQEDRKPDAMLSASIPYCTVMFCCLEPQQDLQAAPTEDFVHLMNTIFSKFDEQVERFGMFKYQHVGDWYIVACPRAACPFDSQEQQKPYPAQYLASMAQLADAMRAIAKTHRLCRVPLWLRVGIHAGPVVGAVVGVIKAFYCLYGDTVNTAARLCKHAGRDHILASVAFADALRPAWPACIRCEAQQEILVKGKGTVSTCRLVLSRQTPSAPPAPDPSACNQDGHDDCGKDNKGELEGWGRLWGRIEALLREAPLEQLVRVTADDLSAEGRMMARSEGYRLRPVRGSFRDSEVERRFLADNSAEHRASVTASILLYLLCAALHLHQCAHPEHPLDFRADGLRELAAARDRMLAILAAHLGLTAAYCAAMLAAVWRDATWCPQCRRHFAVARLGYLAASALAWWAFPGMWRWSICYCAQVLLMLDTTSPSMRTHW